MLTHASPIRLLVTAVVTLLLVTGCGGGAGSAGVGAQSGIIGAGGTGLGIATGFGSLIVDGVRRDDAQASYASEEDQGLGLAMPSTAVMLGHMLEFGYDAHDAMTSVVMSPQLVGPVAATGADGITVLGTRVSANNDSTLGPLTVLAGYASLNAIQVGDRLAVYGLLKTDAQGNAYVQATLIAKKIAGTGVRLSGYVSQYNAATGSFSLGNNTVNIGSALIAPAGAVLANGALVTVWSNTTPAANVISASNIRIKWSAATSGNVTLSGAVSSYLSAASFKLLNVSVDASRATVTPSGATWANGTYVLVSGQYDAATGRLVASALTVYAPPAATAVELHGTVLNYVSAASFTVRGVVVDASTATFSGGSARDLANGVFVEVRGSVANNVVRATTVAIVALDPAQAPTGATLDLMGTIMSYNAATGAYTMAIASGRSMSGMMGSTLLFGNGTAANMAVGQSVTLRGTMSGGSFSPSVVSFNQTDASPGIATPPTPGSSPALVYMEGIAYNVGAASFMLNGLTIMSNGLAVSGGGMMGGRGMMGGSRIGVTVQYSGGQYTAMSIALLGG